MYMKVNDHFSPVLDADPLKILERSQELGSLSPSLPCIPPVMRVFWLLVRVQRSVRPAADFWRTFLSFFTRARSKQREKKVSCVLSSCLRSGFWIHESERHAFFNRQVGGQGVDGWMRGGGVASSPHPTSVPLESCASMKDFFFLLDDGDGGVGVLKAH